MVRRSEVETVSVAWPLSLITYCSVRVLLGVTC